MHVLSQLVRCVLALLLAAALPSVARAGEPESGVSPGRVSLPQGPGSLEGIGENVEPNINMGLMSYPVKIEVPAGYPGMAPALSLGYSSGGGQSVVGMGWSMSLPSIERMTSRGLPEYDRDDLFAANGGSELVRVDNAANVYRERYEGSFVRYTWVDARRNGTEGHWVAEYPDGRVGYFGADADGNLDENAVVRGPNGIFRYHLVEVVDPWGHSTRYEYTKDGSTSLPSRIAWVINDRGAARYEVEFAYEDRRNTSGTLVDTVSTALAGFDIRLTRRLASVDVLSRGALLRRYRLDYQPYAQTGDVTRLDAVTQLGTDGVSVYPIVFRFSYSDEVEPSRPVVIDMGATGVSFAGGSADLIDVNGDALPDVVSTEGGEHFAFFNRIELDADERRWESSSFGPPISIATTSISLANAGTTAFDLDGNGLTDIVDTENEQVLFNDGTGVWREADLPGSINFPDIEDPDRRFVDIDGDKRIDSFRSDGLDTSYRLNLYELPSVGRPLGSGGFVADAFAEDLELGFTADGLQLADMNGDGMQDAVVRSSTDVFYRLNLGRGEWSSTIEMADLEGSWDANATFTDINGDGLADLVNVIGDRVLYAVNRNGRRFDAVRSIRTADLDQGEIPERLSSTQVRFADMNGNGSSDVVWIDASGGVTYLELYPVRPNLLARIENSIGRITTIAYGSSVEHIARDGGAESWEHRLPNPMLTVDEIRQWDTLSGIPQVQRFAYHDGYYDGEEKQFRGFGYVEVLSDGDESMETGRAEHTFDLGVDDPYFHGKALTVTQWSAERVLSVVTNTWDDCTVTGVAASLSTETPVRYVCQAEAETEIREGRPQAEWVVTREEYDYDGYGNRTFSTKHGVVSIGGGGCAACAREPAVYGEPCNRLCVGDETYEATTYVPPTATGGRWMLRMPCVSERYADPASTFRSREETYYDGEPFVGLPLCTLERGGAVRKTARVNPGSTEVIHRERFELNGDGVAIVSMDGNGYRRRYELDADSLQVLAEVVVLDAPWRTNPYELRMEVEYDRTLDEVTTSTAWMLVEGGVSLSTRRETRYAYDVFGRLLGIAKPGDDLSRPTQEFQYDLGDPVSRIITSARTVSGGAPDLESVQCFDGLGRKFQDRTLIEPGLYQVTGFTRFNSQGNDYLVYQPYQGTNNRCDVAPPVGTLFVEATFDSTARSLGLVMPDASVFGTASTTRNEYRPLLTRSWDEEDADPASPHHDTYTDEFVDGLGRVVRTVRMSAPGSLIPAEYFYDGLGALHGWRDAADNIKRQDRNLLGWIEQIDDPDSGTILLEYDDNGAVVRRTDGDGRVVVTTFDEAGRQRETWEDGARESTLREFFVDRLDDCPSVAPCRNAAGTLAGTRYQGVTEAARDFMSYDDRGRLASTARQIEGEWFVFDVAFDNTGRAVRETFPGEYRITRRYDGLNRVVSLAGLAEARFDVRGDLVEVETTNGMRQRYTYDAMRRLERVSVESDDETVLDVEHVRQRTGHFVEDVDRLLLAGRSRSASYTLDSLYRLRVAEFDNARTGRELVTYTFNDIDNLTRVESTLASSPASIGVFDFGADSPHAPIRVRRSGEANVTFGYDGAGRTVAMGDQQFTWSAFGELVGVDAGASSVGAYVYDAGGNRVFADEGGIRRITPSPMVEIARGIVTLHLDVEGARRVVVEYPHRACFVSNCEEPVTFEPNTAETIRRVAEFDSTELRRRLAESAGRNWLGARTAVSSIDVDPVGMARLVIDESGHVTSESASYPYGEVRWSFGVQDRTPALFGHERDATGLIHANARSVSSRFARWMSPDPLFEQLDEVPTREGMNRWLVALGNPVALTDENGQAAETAEPAPTVKDRAVMIGGGALMIVAGAVTLATVAVPATAAAALVTTVTAVGAAGGLAGGAAMIASGASGERMQETKTVAEAISNPAVAALEYGGRAAMTLGGVSPARQDALIAGAKLPLAAVGAGSAALGAVRGGTLQVIGAGAQLGQSALSVRDDSGAFGTAVAGIQSDAASSDASAALSGGSCSMPSFDQPAQSTSPGEFE